MAKKNSLDMQAYMTLPGFTRLEGVILEITPTGIIFDSRKPGGQNRIQEFVPRAELIACVGNEGKAGVLWKFEPQTVFGNKQRNTLMISNPVSYGDTHVRGSNDQHNVVIINATLGKLKNEIKSEEGGRGRKPGKKAKAEKPAKGEKEKKSSKSKKKPDDWQ